MNYLVLISPIRVWYHKADVLARMNGCWNIIGYVKYIILLIWPHLAAISFQTHAR